MEIREKHAPNSGRDPSTLLLSRQQVPKDPKALPEDFPTSVLDVPIADLLELVLPNDFSLGNTIIIFGRVFFLLVLVVRRESENGTENREQRVEGENKKKYREREKKGR